MRLTKFQVYKYQSIHDSNPVDVSDITCLVGKNEAGKTALLQALYKLNPVIPEHANFDFIEDYPRAELEDYRQSIDAGERVHQKIIEAFFELDDGDIAEVTEEFGENCLKSRILYVSKDYDNTRRFRLDVNEKAIGLHLLEKYEITSLSNNQWSNLKELLEILDRKAEEYADQLQKKTAEANAIEDPTAKEQAIKEAKVHQEPPELKAIRSELNTLLQNGPDHHIYNTYLKDQIPLFLYFDEYYQMTGEVNIDQLKDRQSQNKMLDSDRPMLALLELARIKLDEVLEAASTEEFVARLEGASNHLTTKLLKYWSQNKHLDIQFDIRPARPQDPEGMRSGTNLWGRVRNTLHRATTRLGRRSRGFIWFFSFLAWFSQQKKSNDKLILLLDEPGLNLHGTAQADLLRYVEAELKPNHQVIYSTHSPFMVDSTKFDRVRIVEDKTIELEQLDLENTEKLGTKVSVDVLSVSPGTLFPLQNALGYEITQTLFVGKNCLVVEGVSDLLFLQTVSAYLESNGRSSLDSAWTVTPVGGIANVATFVSLLGSQPDLNLVVLVDLQKKDEQDIQNLYKKKLLQKNRVHTFANFTTGSEADIEDVFDPSFYLNLVNSEYKTDLTASIKVKDIKDADPRILRKIEKHLANHPLKKGAKFNHYRPARYLSENPQLCQKMSEASITRFESIFQALNSLVIG